MTEEIKVHFQFTGVKNWKYLGYRSDSGGSNNTPHFPAQSKLVPKGEREVIFLYSSTILIRSKILNYAKDAVIAHNPSIVRQEAG